MGYVSELQRESLERSLAMARETLAALEGRTVAAACDLIAPERAPAPEDTAYAFMFGTLRAQLRFLVEDLEWALASEPHSSVMPPEVPA